MPSYKQLQKQAKELGLKYVGVSQEDLKAAVAEAKEKDSKSVKSEAPQKEEDSRNKDAVVYSGKHKVRTYTLEQHGKDYVKLAKQYVSHPDREGYQVKFEEVRSRIMCPHCGKKFRTP